MIRSPGQDSGAWRTAVPPALLLLCLGGACGNPRAANAADERGLWTLWTQHREAPDQHTAIVDACAAFETSSPQDPFLAVSRTLAAWHLLKAGQRDAARARLVPLVSDRRSNLAVAAADMARQWLTRLDRLLVMDALRDVYRKDVAFPESLAALKAIPADRRPPLTDRWGDPWDYRLIGFKYLKGALDQKYQLRSVRLGDDSELEAALQVPYASRITLGSPTRILTAGTSVIAEFETEGTQGKRTQRISVGSRSAGILFAHMGQYLVVLSDGDHWSILPKTRR